MKILAVDDEKLARDRLDRMLKELGFEYKIAQNADEVFELLKSEDFDLFILDINMPGVDGLELGYELKYKYPNCSVIYQSAYEEHSLKAFDIGAVHYLLKPYTTADLKGAIERVAKPQESKELTFLTKDKDQFYLLRPDDIFYIEADLNEVIFRTKEGFSYYNSKISDMQNLLEVHRFFRIHRSYLVNTTKIKHMSTVEQSKIEFSFDGINDVVTSSKDGAKNFRQYYDG